MIEIEQSENDDINFIQIVERILNAEIRTTEPKYVFITKVDHWFDFKWRTFSHKIFGELGVWREPLRIPPFIPDRIIEENYFEKSGENYSLKDIHQLHIYQNSAENAERKINLISALYIWFSGKTRDNSQGCLMVYKFGIDTQESWYISLLKKKHWQIYKTDNISNSVVKFMIERGVEN